MTDKRLPFSKAWLETLTSRYPTPFHVYDESGIRKDARRFYDAFSWVPGGFKNYFAVKALPNPYIVRMLSAEGMGADCSSLPELMIARAVGLSGGDIMFSSNDTPAAEYRMARELGAIINLDDVSHIPFLESAAGIPDMACMRYNPGALKEGNVIIGKPEEAKYGVTRPQLTAGYRQLKQKGVRRFGLHTMVASNELSNDYFVETAAILFDAVIELSRELDIRFEFVNLGGGVGIPYRPDQTRVDMAYVSEGIHRLYRDRIERAGLAPLRVVMECGRVVTGPHGYLVARVLHKKDTYKQYVGLDACMANLMRPGMYGAYHHITVPGKEQAPKTRRYDVTGSLCENNDKFAIDRELPEIEIGDLVVIHDTGAHGHAMGFNYNGKLRSAELLMHEDGSVDLIRRAETPKDYFSTLSFPGLS